MKSNYAELEKLEKILAELERLYLEGNLTPKRIETAQQRLDMLAASVQRDETLGSHRYVLYEMQSLLHDAAGDVDDARKFANEAAEVKGDGNLITQTVRELVTMASPSENKGKNYTRLEGWLAIFGVGIVFAPFVQLYNFFSNMSTASSTSSSYPGLSALVSIEGFVSLILATLFFVYWPYMAKKKRAARSFGIGLFSGIIGYTIIDMIIGANVLDGVVSSEDLGSIMSKSFLGMLFTTGWLLYLVYSKRVKRTFIK